jgi:hypothetical protein
MDQIHLSPLVDQIQLTLGHISNRRHLSSVMTFPGAGDGITHSWKGFTRADLLPTSAKIICSCKRQERVTYLPMKIPF